MRSWKHWAAAILAICLLLSLCACGAEDPAPSTVPSGSTTPSTTAPTETTVPPTEPPPDPQALYDAAMATLAQQGNLVLAYQFSQDRIVRGEMYTEERTGTAQYAGLSTDTMTAMISENLTYGGYSTQYIESYIGNSGWIRVSNCNFRCEMTADAFLAQQIPATILTSALYSQITAEKTADGFTLLFDGATALESWVATDATLTNANGTITLDADGNATSASYHANYVIAEVAYTLDISVVITTPAELDFSAQQPVYPEESPKINDLRILRHLLRSVGDVYTSNNMSVSYADTMSSQAFGQIRTQNSNYYTYGEGSTFLATLHNQVSITDYAGAVTTNTQKAAFRDGLYSYQYNNGEITTDRNITGDLVRTNWEDSILCALTMPSYIAGATVEDTGDQLLITFRGNDSFAKSLCSGIYALYKMDLDSFASSYSTKQISGYLTIEKATGLPVAMGMRLSRSHVINSVTYELTYQVDQTLELSSPTAYESITGEALKTE